jgi:hypothetical protein
MLLSLKITARTEERVRTICSYLDHAPSLTWLSMSESDVYLSHEADLHLATTLSSLSHLESVKLRHKSIHSTLAVLASKSTIRSLECHVPANISDILSEATAQTQSQTSKATRAILPAVETLRIAGSVEACLTFLSNVTSNCLGFLQLTLSITGYFNVGYTDEQTEQQIVDLAAMIKDKWSSSLVHLVICIPAGTSISISSVALAPIGDCRLLKTFFILGSIEITTQTPGVTWTQFNVLPLIRFVFFLLPWSLIMVYYLIGFACPLDLASRLFPSIIFSMIACFSVLRTTLIFRVGAQHSLLNCSPMYST